MGILLRDIRFGKCPFPHFYSRDMLTDDFPAQVTSVLFSPFISTYFLVGYSDGAVCLFHVDYTKPVCTWNEMVLGSSITRIEWSSTRPGVFFVGDSQRNIYIWDIFHSQKVSL